MLVVGNWKMHPDSLAEVKRIIKDTKKAAKKLTRTKVVLCPPFPVVTYAVSSRKPPLIYAGAQDVYHEERGAYTGEVSAAMLHDIGVEYVIIGHSERRAMGETDAVVARKVEAVVSHGMKAIVCVGEATHDADGAYLETLRQSLRASLVDVSKKHVANLVIAYEPIWAIGAKEAMDPAIVNEMTIFIRKVLADSFGPEAAMRIPILYGGAVNDRNAADLVTMGKVDGLLVGRESVNAAAFADLLQEVDRVA